MNWLRQRREELNLNQEEMTARLQIEGVEVTRSTLSHWETGRYNMPMHEENFRRALVTALRLSEREILKRSGYDIGQRGHSDEAERAADIIDQLPSDRKELALRVLEQFAETG